MTRLSDAEWEVMRVLWARAEGCTLGETAAHLREGGVSWANNTVHTLLTRLHKKGAVEIERESAPFRYRAALAQSECTAQTTRAFVDRVFGGSVSGLFSALLGADEVSEGELDEIERMLAERRRGE